MTFGNKFKFQENKWLRKQLDTHLIFPIFVKYIPFGWFFGFIIGVFLIWNFIEYGINSISELWSIAYLLLLIFCVTPLLLKLSKIQQAAIGWFVLKFVLLIACFLEMTVGTIIPYQNGREEALPNFLIGFIWLPSFEFIPQIVKYQKYLTIISLILTIPIVYLGIQTGDWYWGEKQIRIDSFQIFKNKDTKIESDVVIGQNSIKMGYSVIKSPYDLQKLIELFGNYSKKQSFINDVYIWNELGIEALCPTGLKKVIEVRFIFKKNKFGYAFGTNPKFLFRNNIVLDSFHVNSETTPEDFLNNGFSQDNDSIPYFTKSYKNMKIIANIESESNNLSGLFLSYE